MSYEKNEKLQALTKESQNSEVKNYFTQVLKLRESGKEFPVNLDEVWPLVYGRKDEAVRTLKNSNVFMQDVDYQIFRKNTGQKEGSGGHNRIDYHLSISCMEYLIARKVRPVFEVYRQVFHQAVEQKKLVHNHRKQLYVKGRNNRPTYQQMLDILDDVTEIEDKNLRKALVKNLTSNKDCRVSYKQMVDMMVAVCDIEDRELRTRLKSKLMGGQ